jgi:hypothetical protein
LGASTNKPIFEFRPVGRKLKNAERIFLSIACPYCYTRFPVPENQQQAANFEGLAACFFLIITPMAGYL